MPVWKILMFGIFGVLAVMLITAIIHLIATYIGALLVLAFIVWLEWGNKKQPPDKDNKQDKK